MAYLAVAAAATGQRRERGSTARSAAACSPGCSRGGPIDEVPVGHVTNGVHVPTWDSEPAARLWSERLRGAAVPGSATSRAPRTRIAGLSDERLWEYRSRGRARPSSTTCGRGSRGSSGSGARRTPQVARARAGPRPEPPHARLRPPLRRVQAPDAAAPRPRAARPRCCGIAERPGAAHRRGQGAPGRRGGEGDGPRVRPVRLARRRARTRRLPRGLRHGPRAAPRRGRRRLDQQPAAAGRGVRDERHEGPRQRRPQLLDRSTAGGTRPTSPRSAGRSATGATTTACGDADDASGALRPARAARSVPSSTSGTTIGIPRRWVDARPDEHGEPHGAVLERPDGARVRRSRRTCRPPRRSPPGPPTAARARGRRSRPGRRPSGTDGSPSASVASTWRLPGVVGGAPRGLPRRRPGSTSVRVEAYRGR